MGSPFSVAIGYRLSAISKMAIGKMAIGKMAIGKMAVGYRLSAVSKERFV